MCVCVHICNRQSVCVYIYIGVHRAQVYADARHVIVYKCMCQVMSDYANALLSVVVVVGVVVVVVVVVVVSLVGVSMKCHVV